MLKMTAFLFIVCTASFSFKENPSVSYISQYKEIAISEMLRTGIPASIKMAQALLESGAGKSTLARKANNHFGIKCGGQWNGGEFYREDDDYNKHGKLIKSCFRKFDSVTQSFIAHSEFLSDQRRYKFLFSIKHGNYKAWAYGLKKAGYATDKKYPQKLIDIIEKYELYLLDDGFNGDLLFDAIAQEEKVSEDGVSYAEQEVETKKGIFIYPGAKVKSTAKKQDTKNAQPRGKRRDIVDLDNIHHIVKRGQKISDIARIYNMESNGIRLRNRIPKDAEPLAGEKIFLRKYISLTNRPQFMRFENEKAIAAEDEFIF